MVDSSVQQHIRELEIITKKRMHGTFVGAYRTKIKGSGTEFNQLRDYEAGDDIRSIDWKSSARSDKLLTRSYYEENKRTIYVAVDVSQSVYYGSTAHTKREYMLKSAGLLIWAAHYAGDAVGLILFTDEVEYCMPPVTRRIDIMSMLTQLMGYVPLHATSDLSCVLMHIQKKEFKRSVILVVSDFATPLDEKILQAAAVRHDIIALYCIDPVEKNFPEVGLLTIEDRETGAVYTVQTDASILSQGLEQWHVKQQSILYAKGIDYVVLESLDTVIPSLISFMRKRSV